MLKIQNLGFSYSNNSCVLKNINLDFNNFEIVSILGANGSGKTTLLKCIMGFLKYNGDIYINGKNNKDLSYKERACLISYISQTKNDISDENVYNFLLKGLNPYIEFGKITDTHKEAVNNISLKFNITHLLNRSLTTLSGGEKSKINIIRALLQNTNILVLDEPFSDLDFKEKFEILRLLKNLKNKLVIMTNHNIEEALNFSDTIVVIKNSKVIFKGNSDECVKEDIFSHLYDINIKIQKTEDKFIIIKP